MKYQLRILVSLALLCLSLLCGCHSTPEILPPHTTTMTYCRHDNNYYFYIYHSGNFNPALDTEIPLCFDPLCSHKEYDEKKKYGTRSARRISLIFRQRTHRTANTSTWRPARKTPIIPIR